MDEIFKQYGGPIITVIAIVALIAIVTLLLTTDAGGIVISTFKNLIDKFQQKAGLATIVMNYLG